MSLRAPFPWFGGKSRAAALIWARLGDVANYVEPFAGSLAILLGRPTESRIETVNDLDAMISNFWRAVSLAPDEVAQYADWPVSEPDLHARHRWLVAQLPSHRERMMMDSEYFDAKIAGWWVWGLSQWIGSGWCQGARLERDKGTRPDVHGDRQGHGIHSVIAKRPHCGTAGSGSGSGVHRTGLHKKRPVAGGDNPGRGVHSLQTPRSNGLGGQGLHGARVEGICAWFVALQQRLRRVRICCGDWSRITGPSVILGNGMTGIVLDPPYAVDQRTDGLYVEDGEDVAVASRLWALKHGDDPRLRIALCGYDGEHDMPSSWDCATWKAPSGYGGGKQRHRERIWFSPHCLRPDKGQLKLLEVA